MEEGARDNKHRRWWHLKKINAVVLAGDNKQEEMLKGVYNKALLSIDGRPMVQYVINALRESSYIDKISIVGPVDELSRFLKESVDYYFEGESTLFDNVSIGIKPFEMDMGVLIVTSDIPLISGDIVTDFLDECQGNGADLCYPIIDQKLNKEQFPGVERTYVRLKEGKYTGGNILYINPAAFDHCENFARKLIEYRKKPWKTCKLLGMKFLIGLVVGMLTIPKLEERFSNILDIKASAIVTTHPEICNDVDKPSDLYMVNDYFKRVAH